MFVVVVHSEAVLNKKEEIEVDVFTDLLKVEELIIIVKETRKLYQALQSQSKKTTGQQNEYRSRKTTPTTETTSLLNKIIFFDNLH